MWLACRITAVKHLITVKLQVKFKKFRKLSCGKQKCQTLVQVTIYRRLLIGRDGHFDQSELYENTANRTAQGGLVVRVRVVSDGIIKNHPLRWVMTTSVTNHYTMAADSKPNDLVLIVWNPLPQKVWSRVVYDYAGETWGQRLRRCPYVSPAFVMVLFVSDNTYIWTTVTTQTPSSDCSGWNIHIYLIRI